MRAKGGKSEIALMQYLKERKKEVQMIYKINLLGCFFLLVEKRFMDEYNNE